MGCDWYPVIYNLFFPSKVIEYLFGYCYLCLLLWRYGLWCVLIVSISSEFNLIDNSLISVCISYCSSILFSGKTKNFSLQNTHLNEMTNNFPKILASSVVVVFLLSKAFDNKNKCPPSSSFTFIIISIISFKIV